MVLILSFLAHLNNVQEELLYYLPPALASPDVEVLHQSF